ncbi:MAG: hypothetical protein JW829_16695 [Pirellulales bacterium]|nr:hypothetical protein [Pirellulales bacterium]
MLGLNPAENQISYLFSYPSEGLEAAERAQHRYLQQQAERMPMIYFPYDNGQAVPYAPRP